MVLHCFIFLSTEFQTKVFPQFLIAQSEHIFVAFFIHLPGLLSKWLGFFFFSFFFFKHFTLFQHSLLVMIPTELALRSYTNAFCFRVAIYLIFLLSKAFKTIIILLNKNISKKLEDHKMRSNLMNEYAAASTELVIKTFDFPQNHIMKCN